jgi:hypothetical protein
MAQRAETACGLVTELLIVGEPVLYRARPYKLVAGPDAAGFCILADIEGETIFVHESNIEDSSLRADTAWIFAEENSK